jgi:hypothetical protein
VIEREREPVWRERRGAREKEIETEADVDVVHSCLRVFISDGQLFTQAVLCAELDQLVDDGLLTLHCVVRLRQIVFDFWEQSRCSILVFLADRFILSCCLIPILLAVTALHCGLLLPI